MAGIAKKDSEKGQSTIEFALTMVLLLAFTFFYIQLAMVFAFGNYAHYATFMSARAYLSAGGDDGNLDQKRRAQDTIVVMLKRSLGQAGVDRFGSIARGTGGTEVPGFSVDSDQFSPTDQNLSWMQGVRYTFRSRLFILPMGNLLPNAKSLNSLTLTSESWLLRDPSYEECRSNMGGMNGIFDNGC